MKTKVAVKGAEFYAYHGFYEEERKIGNTFIIDAEVTLKSFDSADDNIMDTVNYEKIYEICKQEMGNTQKLLETFVFQIITRFQAELAHIIGAKVRLDKIAPQMGGKVEKSVVEMEF
ncbi:MAG: dihydroneopterin aldolase [Saprospiraceae bacterium]|nr:dihydroneopterin aldolase [Saprospiraceae bacterium]